MARMHPAHLRSLGLVAVVSLGCSVALDFSRANLPASRDAGALVDAATADLPTDVSDVPAAMDVSDVPAAMDVSDVPAAMDVSDVPDVTDVPDAMDVTDVTDVVDAPDVMDVVDAPDVMDAPDVVDVVDAPDVVDVPVDRGDAGPGCDADLARDPQNCGACGRRCFGTPCNQGVCTYCRAPLTQCGSSCYDLATSTQHCGGCGNRCTGGDPLCCQGECRNRCN